MTDNQKRYEPSKEVWIAAARKEAKEARVRSSDVMAGRTYAKAVDARWRAWKAVLDAHPEFSIAGLARVSGFDHTSILNALVRMNGGLPNKSGPTGRWPTRASKRIHPQSFVLDKFTMDSAQKGA